MDEQAILRLVQELAAQTSQLAAQTSALVWLNKLMGWLLVLLTALCLVGFWWVGHEVHATNIMVREVVKLLRRDRDDR